LFFGLSGTGKTTLSADPMRLLIGDDEHGWTDEGVFNVEGGCYAKCIGLTEEKEPEIYRAIKKGAILENVVLDEEGNPDFESAAITENTRVAYPIEHIGKIMVPSLGSHPKNIIFLTCDAMGVLPPISRLTREQAMFYFLNGYTAKVAGTEKGLDQPKSVFSACFGQPFLPLHPKVYADLLGEKIDQHGSKVWLVNTGWTGGGYGVGSRMKLSHTRAMIHAAFDGSLDKVKYVEDEVFGLHIPTSCPNVPSEVLNPKNTWQDAAAYDAAAHELKRMFDENARSFQ
jgi:phosphoenolpyruvate carboxykinase (ATP)